MTADTSNLNITVEYNHTSGHLEVRLPSGTRVAFSKESQGQVYAFLSWAHMQPKARLLNPLTRQEVATLTKRFLDAGHRIIKPLEDPAEIDLAELDL
jgi:hypothetical protein